MQGDDDWLWWDIITKHFSLFSNSACVQHGYFRNMLGIKPTLHVLYTFYHIYNCYSMHVNTSVKGHRRRTIPFYHVWSNLFALASKLMCLTENKTELIHEPQYSRFDGPIHPMADLEMFFPMNFFWWFLFRGHSRTILAWLPLWQLWANFFISEIPRWPPNDVLHIRNIYLFHKTWSVIHVIRGFRGQGIHFWCYYVHLILS